MWMCSKCCKNISAIVPDMGELLVNLFPKYEVIFL